MAGLSWHVILFLVYARIHMCHAQTSDSESVPMRCCAVAGAPYVMKSGTGQFGYEGISVDYLGKLRERTGLTCKNFTIFADPEGSVAWNALIENIVDCTENGKIKDDPNCKCDIGVGAWFQAPNRLEIDFIPAYTFDDRRVVVHVDDTSLSGEGSFFLRAFAPGVWALVFLLTALFSGLKLLDRKFAPTEQVRTLPKSEGRLKRVKHFLLKNRLLFRLRRAFQSVLTQIIGQGAAIEGEFSSTRQWVLNYVIALCGIFLILVYEATMTAAMVQETVEADFQSINDFKSCRIPDSDVCFAKGDAIEYFWNTAIANSPCRQNRQQGEGPQVFNSYAEVLEKLSSRSCKFMLIDGGTALSAVHGEHCRELTVVGEPFYEGGLSFLLPKGSEHLLRFANATLELHAEGALPTVKEYVEGNGTCNVQRSPHLSVRRLKMFFIIAFVAIFLIFCEMVLDPQSAMRTSKEAGGGRGVEKSAADDREKESESSGCEGDGVCGGRCSVSEDSQLPV